MSDLGSSQPRPLVLVHREQPHDVGHPRLRRDRPTVAEARRASDASLRHRPDPDRRVRLLPRLNVRPHVGHRPESARERHRWLGPQLLDQRQRLVEHGEARGEVDPERVELVPPVAGARPDNESPAASGCRALRDLRRARPGGTAAPGRWSWPASPSRRARRQGARAWGSAAASAGRRTGSAARSSRR